MDNYIYTFHKFHAIFILPAHKFVKFKSILKNAMPIALQLILINDGSFTQNINLLTGKNIYIKMFQKFNKISKKNYRNVRCIWLENNLYTKLLFARSIWALNSINIIDIKTTSNTPLGRSLIQSKTDINKQINEIYYGYCQYLEYKFQFNNPVWGRKYTLYYNKKSYIIIQEFFSPLLVNLFQ